MDWQPLPDGLPSCLSCVESTLDLSQPDEERPELLLGVCYSCRAWHVVAGPAPSRIAALPLPFPAEPEAKSARKPGAIALFGLNEQPSEAGEGFP